MTLGVWESCQCGRVYLPKKRDREREHEWTRRKSRVDLGPAIYEQICKIGCPAFTSQRTFNWQTFRILIVTLLCSFNWLNWLDLKCLKSLTFVLSMFRAQINVLLHNMPSMKNINQNIILISVVRLLWL